MPSKGQGATVRIGSNAVGEIQDYEIALSAEAIEDTCVTDTWRTYKQGIRSFSGSLRAWFDEEDTSQDTLRDAILSGSSTGEVSNLRCEDEYGTTSRGYISGTVVLTEIRVRNPGISGIIEMSCNFQGTGMPTRTDSV